MRKKVLFLSSVLLPEVSKKIGKSGAVSGGWVSTMIEHISKLDFLQLSVVCFADVEKTKRISSNGIDYIVIKNSSNENKLENDIKKVLNVQEPHIIHAEGAEHIHVNLFFRNFNGIRVINIKGIYSSIVNYEYGGLDPLAMLFSFNFSKSLLGLELVFLRYWKGQKRRKSEISAYKLATYLIGRTHWDRAHSKYLNSSAEYFHCNESLRPSFYKKVWDINRINRHSVIIGNGMLARKGAHTMIRALKILLEDYPDIKLYVVGHRRRGVKSKIGYNKFVEGLIRKNGLEGNVEFTGVLDEGSMAEALTTKHVFVLPSSIENSSNSLGEAMLIGVPVVTSYCGGVPDLAKDGSESLHFRSNDHKMLAFQIGRIFENDDLSISLSKAATKKAHMIHSYKKNEEKIMNIYNNILDREIHV